MKISVGSATDVGRARSANEDAYFRDDEGGVFAVADGMGGHRAGDVASSTAVEAVEELLSEGASLVDAIVAANAAVFTRAQQNPEMRGMGTTVTAAQVADESALLAHVGDSRAYLLRDGQLTQITEDHSLVEELVREGRLSPEEAAVHPQRSIITRALGVDEDVEVDTYEIDLLPDDRIVICSDGLTSMVRDDEIVRILRAEDDPQVAADNLVEAANRAGGEDNITVLVIHAEPTGAAKKARRKKAAAASAALEDTGDEATGEWHRIEDVSEDEDEDGDGDEDEDEDEAVAGISTGRRLLRAARWAVPVVAIVAAASVALGWYARSNYFVGLEGEQVVLYQGVPDGFLFWDPTVEARSDLTEGDLRGIDREDVSDGKEFSGRAGAENYLRRLEQKATTTTTSSTTTTAATTSTTPR